MKSISIASLLALAYAANITEPVEVKGEESQVIDFASNYIATLESLLDDEDLTGKTSTRQQPVAGLQLASLSASTLQPSTGVSSAARGLTPADEWRRMFKRKER